MLITCSFYKIIVHRMSSPAAGEEAWGVHNHDLEHTCLHQSFGCSKFHPKIPKETERQGNRMRRTEHSTLARESRAADAAQRALAGQRTVGRDTRHHAPGPARAAEQYTRPAFCRPVQCKSSKAKSSGRPGPFGITPTASHEPDTRGLSIPTDCPGSTPKAAETGSQIWVAPCRGAAATRAPFGLPLSRVCPAGPRQRKAQRRLYILVSGSHKQ